VFRWRGLPRREMRADVMLRALWEGHADETLAFVLPQKKVVPGQGKIGRGGRFSPSRGSKTNEPGGSPGKGDQR